MDMLQKLAEIKASLEASIVKRDEELKQYGKVTDETKASVQKFNDEFTASFKELTERMGKLEAAGNRKGFDDLAEARKSFGAMFIDSPEFKKSRDLKANTVDKVDVKSFFKKDITSGSGSGQALVNPDRLPIIVGPANRPMTIRDLLPVGTTSSNAIEYPRETGFDNQAGPQGTGANGELTPKNKSNLTFTLETAPVRTLAHYIIASRQVLDDATMLSGYIDARLLYGLMLVEENQILYGDGLNQNLEGIMTVASVYDDQYEAEVTNVTRIDRLRLAILQARLAEYPVTGIVLHPTDWAFIELTKDGENRYIWVNVGTGAQPQLWRVPVVDTTAMNEGEFLVGAFSLGAQIWDREQANIRISDQHASLFIQNGVAILAEERIALAIYRPEAFVAGDFDGASA